MNEAKKPPPKLRIIWLTIRTKIPYATLSCGRWRGGAVGAVADNVNENDAVNCGPRGGATGKLTSDVIRRGPDKAEFTEEHPD